MKTLEYLKETFKDIVYGPVKVTDNSNGRKVQPLSDIFDEYVDAAKKYFGRSQFGVSALKNLTDFDGKNSSKSKQLRLITALYLAKVDEINTKFFEKDPGPDFVPIEAIKKLKKAEMLENVRKQQAS